jgi:hypothetical protein
MRVESAPNKTSATTPRATNRFGALSGLRVDIKLTTFFQPMSNDKQELLLAREPDCKRLQQVQL